MKTLVNVPPLDQTGGVSNFYKTLQPYFSEKIEYFTIARHNGGTLKKIWGVFEDVFSFIRKIRKQCYQTAFLNPSLGTTALVRDGLYAVIAKRLCGKRVVIFWHGWDQQFEKKLENSRFFGLFKRVFFRADRMFVLSSEFRKKLVEWGYRNDIVLATTAFPDELLSFSKSGSTKNHIDLLFLARIEKAKGVYEAVDTFILLQKRFPGRLRLIFAGTGREDDALREYVAAGKVPDVAFVGYVRGREKYQLLVDSDLYLFTSNYPEGMPCSLLEAMGAGLPVVTHRIGGVPDFFETGKMGFLLDTLAPADYAEKIAFLLENPEERHAMGIHNKHYAAEHFAASRIAAFIEKRLTFD